MSKYCPAVAAPFGMEGQAEGDLRGRGGEREKKKCDAIETR